VPEGPAARLEEGVGVIGGEGAAARPVHEDGDARARGERRERFGRVVPVDAAAGHHHRALGAGQQGFEPAERFRLDRRSHPVNVTRRNRRQAVLDRRHQEIDGNLDKDRTGPSRERRSDGRRQHLGDLARLRDRPGPFRDRPEERELLGLLERAEPAQSEGRGAADQQQRASRGVGVGDSGDRVGDAGTGNDDGHPDAAREPRVRVSRVGGRLLVTHVDDADAFAETAVVDRQDVAAAQREDVPHARLPQRSGDQLSARQVGHVACATLFSAT
jgi:hypothetical protein